MEDQVLATGSLFRWEDWIKRMSGVPVQGAPGEVWVWPCGEPVASGWRWPQGWILPQCSAPREVASAPCGMLDLNSSTTATTHDFFLGDLVLQKILSWSLQTSTTCSISNIKDISILLEMFKSFHNKSSDVFLFYA